MTKKETIQLGITGVMILFLILIMSKNISKGIKNAQDLRRKTLEAPELMQQPAGMAEEGAQQSASVGFPAGSQASYARLEALSDNLVLKRDPFSNSPVLAQMRPSSAGASLSGIIWDQIKPMAVINGKIVKAGDRVDNDTVVIIKKDRVVLNNGIKDYELKLGE